MGHQIAWEDDGSIGYRCGSDVEMFTVHGVNEGDKVATCPRCNQRLKASWHVTLVTTDEPETDS